MKGGWASTKVTRHICQKDELVTKVRAISCGQIVTSQAAKQQEHGEEWKAEQFGAGSFHSKLHEKKR